MKKTVISTSFLVIVAVLPLHAVPVRVGVYLQPPLTTFSKTEKIPAGLCIDVLNAAAQKRGWSVTYVTDSRVGILNKLWRKEIDLMVPAPLPMEKSELLDYTSAGVLSSYGQLFAREPLRSPSFQELSGKTVAVLRGDIHYARLMDILKGAQITCQIIEMQNYEDVFEAVRSQRADVGLIDHFQGNNTCIEYGLNPTPLVTPPVNFHVAALHAVNNPLLEGMNQELAAALHDTHSAYFDSLSKWVKYHPPYSSALLAIMVVAGLLGSGLLLLITVTQVRQRFLEQSRRMVAANRQLLKNVDDHMRGEVEARGREDWYRSLLNSMPDPMFIHGVDAAGRAGKFLEVNDTACLRLGYSRKELLGLSLRDIEVNPETASKPRYARLLTQWRNARLPDAVNQEKDVGSLSEEITLRAQSGVEIPVEIIIRILEHNDQPVIYYTTHDITLRRQTQQALKESERRFSDFFARSPIGVALYNPKRQVTEVNQSALAMFGLSERSSFAATRLLDSGDLSNEAQTTLLKGGTVRYEAVIDFDEVRKKERYVTSRTGKCHFDILITNLGLNADYSPKGFMLQIQDITDRRRAEESLHQHERLLRQAQKMEAIGTLAGGIAHDFNNILTPIIGYTEMALATVNPDDPVFSNLDEVLKASHRAKELVKQILTFSRQSEQEIKPIHLIPLIKEVVKLLRGSILATTELLTTIEAERDIVKADPTQIHQIIMNLCTNALHAMKDKVGVLEVGLTQTVVDSRTRGPLARLRHGAYVEIYVRDTGHGMERAVLDRIFEPFFTTKQSGEGTGMGLAVVHGIVASLQGAITVDSAVGKGTTFHIVLPLMEQVAEHTPAVLMPLVKGTERILFVDDEPGIVAMVNQMLTSLGYQVTTFSRPHEALTLFKEDPTRFDLIISDQVMPGMTGIEMVREMHLLRDDIPVIICTGFSKTISDRDLLAEGVREILMKPIILRQLAESIRRALSPGANSAKTVPVVTHSHPPSGLLHR